MTAYPITTATWYLIATDHNPSTDVWDVPNGAYVSQAGDAGYLAFVAAGNVAVTFSTEAEIFAFIAAQAATYYAGGGGSGYHNINSAIDVALTNPGYDVYAVTMSAAGKYVTLAQANLPTSRPPGKTIRMINGGSNSFGVKNYTGSVLLTVPVGATGLFTPAVFDGTTAGSFSSISHYGIKSVYIIGASAIAGSAHTGDTNETTLATITVPANSLGANGRLRITAVCRFTGTADVKTIRIKFGGTEFYKQATGATALSARGQADLSNRNATNSQVAVGTIAGGWGGSTADVYTAAIDTTSAQDVTITGQLTNAGDSVAIADYLVELLVP